MLDAQLAADGWIVQDYNAANLSAGRGIVLREVPLTTGPCDYLLLVDRNPVGVIEAKKEGTTLSTVAEQSGRYANSLPPFLAAGLSGKLPFLYESTGVETFFRDERDPAPRPRRVFTFHRPETLAEWAAEPDTLRRRIAQMPIAHPLATTGMRDCQVEAISGLEKSFAEDRPRDVRSRVYFEQMKGHGTRVVTPTDLQSVSGEDARAKTRFVIVDAVGVCESDKTESHPLDRQPTVPLKTLLQRVIFPGGRDEDTLTTLAARLARLDRELEPVQRQQIVQASGGHTPASLANALLRAFDPDEVAAASRRLLLNQLNDPTAPDDFSRAVIGYFDPEAPVAHLTGDLPHWRQPGVTYFVTFRLADSLPQEKLAQWRTELARWHEEHPEPHDGATRQEFYNRFPARLQRWLEAGHGSCVLEIDSIRLLVENALRHFDRTRYSLDEFVVAKNHVHVLVTPLGEHTLSEILHSWKSFTAHEILKVEAAFRRLSAAQGNPIPVSYKQGGSGVPPLNQKAKQSRDGSATASATLKVWQKESFDHIVRSPASLEKFRQYIRAHDAEADAGLCLSEGLRRDVAATLIAAACAPFDKPALRQTLESPKGETEQAIDIYTPGFFREFRG